MRSRRGIVAAAAGDAADLDAGRFDAFSAKAQLSSDILLAEIHGTLPLSVTRAEDIQGVREWAKSRAVAAD